MATVRLGRYEVTERLLPLACLRCGTEATVHKQKTFSWHPPWVTILILAGLLPLIWLRLGDVPWVTILILAGLLPYAIVAIILTKRMTVHAPLCEQHRHHWLWRTRYVTLGLLWFLGLAIAGIGLLASKGDIAGFVCLGTAVAGLLWLISAAIIQHLAIRPTEITERSISLTNVSPHFIEALREERAYRHGEESRRPRRRRRYEEENEDWEEV